MGTGTFSFTPILIIKNHQVKFSDSIFKTNKRNIKHVITSYSSFSEDV